MQSEQPDTPATEPTPKNPPVAATEPTVARDQPLPIARPVRPASKRVAKPTVPSRRTTIFIRVALLVVAAVLTAIFVAAYRIYPYDENGNALTMSTHTQLGMPRCNFVDMTGKPCPSCGMTTSFALLVRGDVVASARANWVGSVICVLWALTLVWAVASSIRGKMLFVSRGRGEITFTALVGVVLILMLARWAAILVE